MLQSYIWGSVLVETVVIIAESTCTRARSMAPILSKLAKNLFQILPATDNVHRAEIYGSKPCSPHIQSIMEWVTYGLKYTLVQSCPHEC